MIYKATAGRGERGSGSTAESAAQCEREEAFRLRLIRLMWHISRLSGEQQLYLKAMTVTVTLSIVPLRSCSARAKSTKSVAGSLPAL